MDSVTISQRTGFSRAQLGWMLGILLAGEAIGLSVSYATRISHSALSTAFASGAVALLFGALLGGIVTQLLTELDRRRLWRASEIEFITNILTSLKSAYDQVDRARTLISAHQSAKTYGEQMQKVIEARVTLLQVMRALKFDTRREPGIAALQHVEQMEAYLKGLVDEFEERYKDVSREQSVYEARMKAALTAPNTEARDLPANTPWTRIVAQRRIRDFLHLFDGQERSTAGSRSDYEGIFIESLDLASSALRNALAAELGEPRGAAT